MPAIPFGRLEQRSSLERGEEEPENTQTAPGEFVREESGADGGLRT